MLCTYLLVLIAAQCTVGSQIVINQLLEFHSDLLIFSLDFICNLA